jgi:hypothetical protein
MHGGANSRGIDYIAMLAIQTANGFGRAGEHGSLHILANAGRSVRKPLPVCPVCTSSLHIHDHVCFAAYWQLPWYSGESQCELFALKWIEALIVAAAES